MPVNRRVLPPSRSQLRLQRTQRPPKKELSGGAVVAAVEDAVVLVALRKRPMSWMLKWWIILEFLTEKLQLALLSLRLETLIWMRRFW
jgi:hypothetical protein